jgi:hypothetical protein
MLIKGSHIVESSVRKCRKPAIVVPQKPLDPSSGDARGCPNCHQTPRAHDAHYEHPRIAHMKGTAERHAQQPGESAWQRVG